MSGPRPAQGPDALLVELTDYALDYVPRDPDAYETAHYCLIDSLGCALRALDDPYCRRVLGPLVEGLTVHGGIRLPGSAQPLDPVQGAFNLGGMIRWLDFNDTWLAAEWGHPSDNLGGILAAACLAASRGSPVRVHDVLTAMIKAYEIQGCLALGNSLNEAGIDHVVLVRVASALVTTVLLGATRAQTLAAVSNAWVDGATLRCYRHAPDAGSRKGWAAGDATARGLWLALLALRGETGYPHALTTPAWGFQDALLHGRELVLERALGCYVMPNILFKVAYPAEFHGQTAVEAAIRLHPLVRGRWDDIARIRIETQRAGLCIIHKTGPLANPADRDHSLQYMVAVALLRGDLESADYHEERAADPRIDALRACMEVVENADFTRAYHDPTRRAIPNAVQIFFGGGGHSERIVVDYPLGHRRRRREAWPRLRRKFRDGVERALGRRRCERILALLDDPRRLDAMPIADFIALFG